MHDLCKVKGVGFQFSQMYQRLQTSTYYPKNKNKITITDNVTRHHEVTQRFGHLHPVIIRRGPHCIVLPSRVNVLSDCHDLTAQMLDLVYRIKAPLLFNRRSALVEMEQLHNSCSIMFLLSKILCGFIGGVHTQVGW